MEPSMPTLTPSSPWMQVSYRQVCKCGNKIAVVDTHSACSSCLWMQHAQDVLASLVVQVRVPSQPVSGVTYGGGIHPPSLGLGQQYPGKLHPHGNQLLISSTPSTHYLTWTTMVPANLWCTLFWRDNSESGEEPQPRFWWGQVECQTFLHPTSCKFAGCGSPYPSANMDLHDTRKRAAAKHCIACPEALAETTMCRSVGKRLPKAKSSSRQLQLVFLSA